MYNEVMSSVTSISFFMMESILFNFLRKSLVSFTYDLDSFTTGARK